MPVVREALPGEEVLIAAASLAAVDVGDAAMAAASLWGKKPNVPNAASMKRDSGNDGGKRAVISGG